MSSENDFSKVIAKAWANEGFRTKLINDPHGTLKAEGWTIPPSVKIEVKPDVSEHHFTLGLPKRPAGVSDEELIKKAEDVICVRICFC